MRHLAQVGAAIGREFSYKLLDAVSGVAENELAVGLEQLVNSGLVFQRGVPPDAVYSFKHALVQDTAHGSLLRRTRQRLHSRIAEVLEAQSPELAETQPEIVAHHYAEGGQTQKSVAFWRQAGRQAAARSAMSEATSQFERGLSEWALLPETPERHQQELDFTYALGTALSAAKGLAASETGRAYARARELWEQLGFPSEFLAVPQELSIFHGTRGDIDLARACDEDVLRISRERGDAAGLVLGYGSSARNLFHAGSFTASRTHLDELLRLYDPNAHRPHSLAAAHAHLGIVLGCLGFPTQGLAHSQTAISRASA